MQRPPPRSTRTDTLFPYTTPSDLNDVPRLAGQSVTCGVAGDQFQLAKRRVRNRGKPPHDRLADMRPNARVAQDRLQVGEIRSEGHTSELQSLMRSSYAVFYLTKNQTTMKPAHILRPTTTTQ